MTDHIEISTEQWDRLSSAATSAREHAVADFSGFRVGAAVLTAAGAVFTGCNIENDSYCLTICAERVAIFNSVAGSPTRPTIVAVVVAVEEGAVGVPCGACRQVIHMFGPEALVSYQPGPTARRVRSAADLLPEPYRLAPG